MIRFSGFLAATGVLLALQGGQMAQAATSGDPAYCLNRCQRYQVFCNTEIIRQYRELVRENRPTCAKPELSLPDYLQECRKATQACQESCFAPKRPVR